ncbi:hypothetical protein DS2_12904 [Catenovulum agarivorans DS-2]|uniref:Uncharacterized protein n=2 Tax=Catenovulum agarivorans TaxID=1172192 RepID=W7QNE5_9ALTE|nr:hypothetical protein DS2_12904 [Catenovulum agarivorans DS-2]
MLCTYYKGAAINTFDEDGNGEQTNQLQFAWMQFASAQGWLAAIGELVGISSRFCGGEIALYKGANMPI